MTILCTSALVFIILWIVNYLLGINHPFWSSLKASASGVFTLALLESLASFTDVTIPLNLIVIASSMLLGIPGVGTLLILNTIFA